MAKMKPLMLEGTVRMLEGVNKRLIGMMPRDRGIKILDVGCGRGEFIGMLKDYGYKNIVGIDIRKYDCVDVCKKKFKGMKFYKMDANEKLRFKDKSFDVVAAIELLEHVHSPYHTLKEISRICRGDIIIVVPNQFPTEVVSRFTGRYCNGLTPTQITMDNIIKMLNLEIVRWEYYYGSFGFIRKISPQYLSTGFIIQLRKKRNRK